ncbi:MAG: hypothetical protein J5J00_17040 [Deltaproteobacteria bacterium]|nr:hypothetical protein [Deltaproteobacteria bacterium]
MRNLIRLPILLLVIAAWREDVNAKPKLPAPKISRIEYKAASDALDLRWQSTSNGKFEIVISGAEQGVIFSKRSKSRRLTIQPDVFSEGQSYSVRIRALAVGGFAASKARSKSFTFSTRVKTAQLEARLKTENSTGRSGSYFLPKNYRLKSLPLMVVLHGSSIEGETILKIFKMHAKAGQFFILAPDSVNEWGWEISTDTPTEDQLHIGRSLQEFLELPHLSINTDKVMIAGVSAGGTVASFIGSRNELFTHIAVLHGGAGLSFIGDHRAPFWLSTGTQDTLRPPGEVSGYTEPLKVLGFSPVSYSEFAGGHEVPEAERSALIEWWLGSE